MARGVAFSLAALTALYGALAHAGEGCGSPINSRAACDRPVVVHVYPKYVPAPCRPHHALCRCLPPPRAEIVDTVAVQRIAPPFVRQELVVSREQLRVIPVLGEERLGEAPPQEQRSAPPACPSDPYRSQAAAPRDASVESLEQRLSRLEQGLAALKEVLVNERKRELERLPAAK